MLTRKKTICVLSLDGCGLKGFSQLLILHEIMYRIRRDNNLDYLPKPCQYFDIIGGTAMGGIIALLLGRLRMTTLQAIEAYLKLTTFVFSDPKKIGKKAKFKATKFQTVFSEIMRQAGVSPDARMRDEDLEETDCKTFVCAMTPGDLSSCYRFRTYHTRSNNTPNCTILEAARAAIASPSLFKPVRLADMDFIDASVNYANPIKEAMQEAQYACGIEKEVACIVSIGTGKGELESMKASLRFNNSIPALSKISLDSERTHTELESRFQNLGIYFRFNVERGLETLAFQEWKYSSAIRTHVNAYIDGPIVTKQLDTAVQAMGVQSGGPSIGELNTPVVVDVMLKPRPSITPHFLGRDSLVGKLSSQHFLPRHHLETGPNISVLSGMGGAGKTQVALKFAAEYEKRFPDDPILFIDASSKEQLEIDLQNIIRSRGSAYRTKSYSDAISWLSVERPKWLLIFDNADDASFDVFDYFPKSQEGSILVTTRNPQNGALALHSWYNVAELTVSDATTLLLTASHYPPTETHLILAKRIVVELGCLPLAIAQAAGYIFIHRCLSTYMDIYSQSRRALLSANYGIKPDAYKLPVYATISLSFRRLSPQQQNLLKLLSFLHPFAINHRIFMLASRDNFESVVNDLGQPKSDQLLKDAADLREILGGNLWSEYALNEVISAIQQYSLMQTNGSDHTKFYSMHVLVRMWLQDQMTKEDRVQMQQACVRLLSAAIRVGSQFEFIQVNQLLLPHLQELPKTLNLAPVDANAFAWVIEECGDYKESGALYERAFEGAKETLGKDHVESVYLEFNLGRSYFRQGFFDKAALLWEDVLVIRRELLGEEHPDTLKVINNLGLIAGIRGQFQKAIPMLTKVYEGRIRAFGKEHADTLNALDNLTDLYRESGNYNKAAELGEKVLDASKRVLGPDNPNTLRAMEDLSLTYRAQGRYQEAADLGEAATENTKRVLGEDHPFSLISMLNLAKTCRENGDIERGAALAEKVTAAHKTILGVEHPLTLQAVSEYADALHSKGEIERAAEIRAEVLAVQERLVGKEHPDALRAMSDMVETYIAQYRNEKAIELGRQVLDTRRSLLGSLHPSTFTSMEQLARALENVGLQGEAELLFREALAGREERMGSSHPLTIKSRQSLDVILKRRHGSRIITPLSPIESEEYISPM